MRGDASRAVVLLSGGQDSTTCLYWAKEKFEEVHAVSFNYGQRHGSEIEQAHKIAKMAGTKSWRVLEFAALKQLKDAALTNPGEEVSLQGRYPGLPSTFVPGRNSIFLTLAAALARKLGIYHLVTGVCQTDYSGYPDCRRTFIDAKTVELSLAMDWAFVVFTPLMFKTKAESVVMAKSLPGCWAALALSRTCYHGKFPPCRECPACKIRAKGFEEAGFKDPALKDVQSRSSCTEAAYAMSTTPGPGPTVTLHNRRKGDRHKVAGG